MLKIFIIFVLLFLDLYGAEKISYNGFLTLSSVYNDNENYIFRSTTKNKNGSSKDFSFDVDSILGVQIGYEYDERLSWIIQGVVKKNYDGSNTPSIEWAYLKYKLKDNLDLKLGRMRAPLYMYSDSLNIGYANIWVRPPMEVYAQIPFSWFDGVSLLYGDMLNSNYFYRLEATLGQSSLKVPAHSLGYEVDVKLKKLHSISLSVSNDIFEARIAYFSSKTTAISSDIDSLFNALRLSSYIDLADKYELVDKTSKYYNIGLKFEYENFFSIAEYGKRETNSFYGDIHGWYITVGYKYSELTPFITLASATLDQPLNNNTVATGALNSAFNSLLEAQNIAQNSYSLGLKYDFYEKINFKFQYDHINPKDIYGSYHLSSSADTSDLNVYSFALNMVF